jgi:large subunit ribosomal protein L6
MSRIGQAPIGLPEGVQVDCSSGGLVKVCGPLGSLQLQLQTGITVDNADGEVRVLRRNNSARLRSLHGLFRTLIANNVIGVTQGYSKTLDIVGTGYRAQPHAEGIEMQIGMSHPVVFRAPDGIELQLEGSNRVSVRGIDKELVGRTAANLRAVRKPDAYKGKGLRYSGEVVRLKPGKSAIGAGR